MCRDSRIVPGAAATEIELAKKLKEFSLKEIGYVISLLGRILSLNGKILFIAKYSMWLPSISQNY
jgi:hypothetical protein